MQIGPQSPAAAKLFYSISIAGYQQFWKTGMRITSTSTTQLPRLFYALKQLPIAPPKLAESSVSNHSNSSFN
jgi:hypothetical protein